MKNSKLYKFINKIFDFDKKYNLVMLSATLSFYTLVSLISLFIIFIQIINYKYDLMDNMLISKLLSIFSNSFIDYLKEELDNFTLNNYTSFSIIALFWSASGTVNLYNKIADIIYAEVEKRNSIKLRINSLLMFLMLFVIVMFEIIFIISSRYLIEKYFKINNQIVINLLELIIDWFTIYILLIILYIYVPPLKMYLKDVFKGAFIVSSILYIFLNGYSFIISLYKKVNSSVTISFVLNSILIFIFIVNYLVILGIIINYKNGKNMKNKKENYV